MAVLLEVRSDNLFRFIIEIKVFEKILQCTCKVAVVYIPRAYHLANSAIYLYLFFRAGTRAAIAAAAWRS